MKDLAVHPFFFSCWTGVCAYFGVLNDQSFVDQNLLSPLRCSLSLNEEIYLLYFIVMEFCSVQIILAFYVEMKQKRISGL